MIIITCWKGRGFVSDFNHFSIRRGNKKHIVQKRNANSAEAKKNIDIAYFLSLLTGGIVWIFRVIKITFSCGRIGTS